MDKRFIIFFFVCVCVLFDKEQRVKKKKIIAALPIGSIDTHKVNVYYTSIQLSIRLFKCFQGVDCLIP